MTIAVIFGVQQNCGCSGSGHGVLELVVPLPVELAGKKIPIQIEAGKTIESKAA